MSGYSLQRYKGTATRHTCPGCGDRHSFAYYVDEQDTPLHPSVGATMKAVAGITTPPSNTFGNIPNVVPQMISLPAGEKWNKSLNRYHSRVP